MALCSVGCSPSHTCCASAGVWRGNYCKAKETRTILRHLAKGFGEQKSRSCTMGWDGAALPHASINRMVWAAAAESTWGREYLWQVDLMVMYGSRGLALIHNVLAKSVTPPAAGSRARQAPSQGRQAARGPAGGSGTPIPAAGITEGRQNRPRAP